MTKEAVVRTETDLYEGTERMFHPGTLIRWGAIFAGSIFAFAFMTLFTTLWVALANDPDTGAGAFNDYLNWWVGGTAIVALGLGSMLAGWLTTVRGMVSGVVHGVTVWGLVLFASAFITLPGLGAADISLQPAWTLFWTFLIGLGVATFGGIVGGGMPAPGQRERRHDEVDVRTTTATTPRESALR